MYGWGRASLRIAVGSNGPRSLSVDGNGLLTLEEMKDKFRVLMKITLQCDLCLNLDVANMTSRYNKSF